MEQQSVSKFPTRDFLVEFLGAFVPGLIFTAIVLLMLTWSGKSFVTTIHAFAIRVANRDIEENRRAGAASNTTFVASSPTLKDHGDAPIVPEVQSPNQTGLIDQVVKSSSVIFFFLISAMSYTIGMIAFRGRVERVDKASWRRMYGSIILASGPRFAKQAGGLEGAISNLVRKLVLKGAYRSIKIRQLIKADSHGKKDVRFWEDFVGTWACNLRIGFKHRQRLASEIENLIKSSCRSLEECEFPYISLKQYFLNRGLTSLAEMVPWDPNEPESRRFCTAEFINVLKLRIKLYHPSAFSDLAKQEAIVRNFSSSWYLCRWLHKLSMVLIFTMVAICTASYFAKIFFDTLGAFSLSSSIVFIFSAGITAFFPVYLNLKFRSFFRPRRLHEQFHIKETEAVTLATLISLSLALLLASITMFALMPTLTFLETVKFALMSVLDRGAIISFLLMTFVASETGMIAIEKEFHRFRKQEVLYVFHTVWLCFRHQSELISDILPQWSPSLRNLVKPFFDKQGVQPSSVEKTAGDTD